MTLRARLDDMRRSAARLRQRAAAHGSIDQYLRSTCGEGDPRALALALGGSGGAHKLPGFGVPLAAEALRNIGFDIAKPDRHVCRFVGARGWLQFRRWEREGPWAAPTASEPELIRVMEHMEKFALACG